MQRQRYPEVLRRGPERIVVGVAVGTLVRRLRPDHRTAHPFLCDAREFGSARGDVFKRDEPKRDEPVEIVAAVFDGPVVERAKACGAQFDVIESEQRHSHRGVDDLGLDAVAVLILDAVGRVPYAFRRRVEALFRCSGSSCDGTPAPKNPATAVGLTFWHTKNSPSSPLRFLTVCGARSRNFLAMRSAHILGGSTKWESAEMRR